MHASIAVPHPLGYRKLILFLVLVGSCQSGTAPARDEAPADKTYEVVYTIRLQAGEPVAEAGIRIGRGARRLRELSFDFDPDRYSDFSADGELTVTGNELTWHPPREGGALRYRVNVPHQRSDGEYDARVTGDWALFRGGDIFPPAASRVLVGSRSVSRLELELPTGWSAVTPYPSGEHDLSFPVRNSDRNFVRPTGWMLAGDIGVRRGRIAGVRVAIAAPKNQGFRRMDVMAFLNWTLPSLVELFPTMDGRLVIVSANDPMWRGGLSGPASLYVHADRPLISENGTSTFLHELVHVAMGAAGPEHDDWLLEGLAEYYSVKILRESGTLSRRRMTLALEDLEDWGAGVDDLWVRRASGEVMARAATLLAALDAELEQLAPDAGGLDAVVAAMLENDDPYSYRALCTAARQVAGKPVPLLEPSRVPGAPRVAECAVDSDSAGP